MQFTYRGVSYKAPVTGTEMAESEQIGTFLGATYKVKQGGTVQQRHPHQLTYRGVRYSQ
ncbi:MAG: DUF4278 domain-containing protein [Leptolyngbya sp. SIO1E4]|nr:DUF4278 domain-containing protein [Leptolyngbya sp. SIO1E4]